MSPTRTGTLGVPGARLHYKVRGSGPFLLILQGGDGDADASDALAGQLEDFRTIVTYDRRGLSRSTVDEGAPPLSIQTHAEDAHHLMAVLPQPSRQRGANLEFFRVYDAPAAHGYQPDIAALAGATPRIIIAVGQKSRGIWPHRTAELLAGLLGRKVIEFPGGQNGFVLHPIAFAARLCEVLGWDPSDSQG